MVRRSLRQCKAGVELGRFVQLVRLGDWLYDLFAFAFDLVQLV